MVKTYEVKQRRQVQAVQWRDTNFAEIVSLCDSEFVKMNDLSLKLKAGPHGYSGWVTVPVGGWVVRKDNDRWPCNNKAFLDMYGEVVPA